MVLTHWLAVGFAGYTRNLRFCISLDHKSAHNSDNSGTNLVANSNSVSVHRHHYDYSLIPRFFLDSYNW